MKVMLDEGAYMPKYAHDTDGGMDIRCRDSFYLPAA